MCAKHIPVCVAHASLFEDGSVCIFTAGLSLVRVNQQIERGPETCMSNDVMDSGEKNRIESVDKGNVVCFSLHSYLWLIFYKENITLV